MKAGKIGYEFEDFCELFIKGYVRATKEEDQLGVDGWMYGDIAVQCKSMIHSKNNCGYSQFNIVDDYDIAQCFLMALPAVISTNPYRLDKYHFVVRLINCKDVKKMALFSTSKGGRGSYVENKKKKSMERLLKNSSALLYDGDNEKIFENELLR